MYSIGTKATSMASKYCGTGDRLWQTSIGCQGPNEIGECNEK
jgi:hypothetical protein